MSVVSDCGPLTAPPCLFMCPWANQLPSVPWFPHPYNGIIVVISSKKLLGELNEMMNLVHGNHSIVFPLPLMM